MISLAAKIYFFKLPILSVFCIQKAALILRPSSPTRSLRFQFQPLNTVSRQPEPQDVILNISCSRKKTLRELSLLFYIYIIFYKKFK